MRLAGIEKGGYYPYPPNMAEATASWFIPLPEGTRGRILDISQALAWFGDSHFDQAMNQMLPPTDFHLIQHGLPKRREGRDGIRDMVHGFHFPARVVNRTATGQST